MTESVAREPSFSKRPGEPYVCLLIGSVVDVRAKDVQIRRDRSFDDAPVVLNHARHRRSRLAELALINALATPERYGYQTLERGLIRMVLIH